MTGPNEAARESRQPRAGKSSTVLEMPSAPDYTGPRSNLEWALEYARRGWPIFPCTYMLRDGICSCGDQDCTRPGKHPIARWKKQAFAVHGHKDATTDLSTIERWWKAAPHANIGLATGHNGITVLDVDVSKGKKGAETLAGLEAQHGPLPSTLEAETGSGGRHLYFIATGAIDSSQDRVGQHLDVRANGGYVILPPSNHESGNRYLWRKEGAIAVLPDWLAALMATRVAVEKDVPETFLREDITNSLTKLDIQQVLKKIPADDRDVWWKCGAALKNEWGDEAFDMWDEWSQTADNYDGKIQQVQWRSFKPDKVTLGTIIHFAKENGWRGFDKEAADSPEIRDNWHFVVGIKRFVDLGTLTELDREQFDCQYAHNFRKGRASEHVLRNDSFVKLDAVTYWPDQEQIVSETGQRKLNYWRPPAVIPAVGDVEPFLSHLDYLFADQDERAILLNYLAFQVQHPGAKVHWAILLQGQQGTGKSYLAAVMKGVLGERNVRALPNDVLQETFTNYLKNVQFLVVEEMMARGRVELMNKLKPMITEPWLSIREMYKPPYEIPNRVNFLFLTNHPDSIILTKDDRRYCVLSSKAVPKSPEYYGRLFDWTRNNYPALAHFLRQHPLANFQPHAHAPVTEAKRRLVEESMGDVEQWCYQRYQAREWPFNVKLILPDDLVKALNERNLRSTPKQLGRVFVNLGLTPLGYKRIGRDKDSSGKWAQINLYAVDEADRYEAMDAHDLRLCWMNQATMVNDPDGGGPDRKTDDAMLRARRGLNVVEETEDFGGSNLPPEPKIN